MGVTFSVFENQWGGWNEGDEMIWIDGEAEPRIHGTGGEDYFCGAWDYQHAFANPYSGVPLYDNREKGGEKRGILNTCYRWHILDPIPFREHIGFFMELFHHSKTEGLSYARTAYFYAPPQTRDDAVRIGPSDVRLGMKLPGG